MILLPVVVDSKENLQNSELIIPDGVICKEEGSNAFKIGNGVDVYTNLNNSFAGNGTTGFVPDPGNVGSGQVLHSDGNWRNYEIADVLENSQTITHTSSKTTVLKTSGECSLTFVPAEENISAMKLIYINAVEESSLTYEGARWAQSKSAPTYGAEGSYLTLMAHFIAGEVVLHVLDSSEPGTQIKFGSLTVADLV